MERLERLYRFDRLLRTRPAISRQELEQTFEVSRATFRRDLEYLRDRLGYPIVYDAQLGGYRLEPGAGGEATVQLPGVWFSSGELHSLLALVEVLREADPGVLDRVVEAVRHRTLSLLGRKSERDYDIARRIRVLSLGHRPVSPAIFEAVTTALFERRRLRITYALRSNGGVKEREISPQRLVRFRDNWFLDAWCHDRNGLRVLAVDAIERAAVLAVTAREAPVEVLNEVLGSRYGLASRRQQNVAELRFAPRVARWIANERWHEAQQGSLLADGSYLLSIPYHSVDELLTDVLRYGPDVEVLAPQPLRLSVITRLRAALACYSDH